MYVVVRLQVCELSLTSLLSRLSDDVDVIIVPVMANGNESLQKPACWSRVSGRFVNQQLGAVLGDSK